MSANDWLAQHIVLQRLELVFFTVAEQEELML